VFAGSQNLYADILAEAHGRTADLVVRLAGAASQPVRYVNLGGGLGIPYFERDQALDLATIDDNLAAVMSEPRGHTFLIVDGGLHHQLAASGNFGQIIRKNYPVAIANRMSASRVPRLAT
jgi:diaminopimelate decarboxylase